MGSKLVWRTGVLAAAAVLAMLGGSFAGAAEVRYGTLVLRADGGFTPRVLPKRQFAPIHFQGYGNISTTDGSIPPRAEHVKLEFDRDGRLTTAGLSVCQPASIESASPKRARQLCKASIVGRGNLAATAALPGAGRVQMRSALTIFNGPRQGGNPTAILHAQAPAPVSETYVVVVPIERRAGIYGYRAEFDVPAIAGGLGSLTHIEAKIGRTYMVAGRERSYASARCSDYILQTRGFFSFADSGVIYGSVFKTCRPEG